VLPLLLLTMLLNCCCLLLAGVVQGGDDMPTFNVSYKPQKISPKFEGTVRQLLHKKIRDSYLHPQVGRGWVEAGAHAMFTRQHLQAGTICCVWA
jgi:hypothetical protein